MKHSPKSTPKSTVRHQHTRNLFGSWQDALLAAGFSETVVEKRDPEYGNADETYSDDELIAQIRQVGDQIGRTPRLVEFQGLAEASVTTVADRFGSWNSALVKAGFDVTKPHEESDKYTDEELLDYIRAVAGRLGESPSVRQMRSIEGVPSTNTYQRRFGSWKAAKEAALGDETSQEANPDVE
jgi:hypothetical protein